MKKYIKPSMETIVISEKYSVLSGSYPYGTTVSQTAADHTSVLSRDDNYDCWDEDEDEE